MADLVNMNRLLKLLPDFFASPSTMLIELAQNACRAKAKSLAITLTDGVLTVKDDGAGADVAAPLVVLAESGWNTPAVKAQSPAGWGLFFSIVLSKQISFCSKFGTLSIDCERFMEDAAYRGTVLSTVDIKAKGTGMTIVATLRKEAAEKILDSAERDLRFFPINISINGKEVHKEVIEVSDHDIVTTYEGNDVYIKLPQIWTHRGSTFTKKNFLAELNVIWYGQNIEAKQYYNAACIIDVKKGQPVTPILPLRNGIKDDARLEKLRLFCKKVVIDYCTNIINKGKSKKELDKLETAICVMASIDASQKVINSLNRWSVAEEDSHHFIDDGRETRSTVIVKRGDTLVSEKVKVTIYKKGCKALVYRDHDDLHLPSGTVTGVSTMFAGKKPDWLKIRHKTVNIRIDAEQVYSGALSWYKSTITCKGRDVKVIGIAERHAGSGEVYYATPKARDSFGSIENSIFCQAIYHEDSGSWDDQQTNNERDMERDLSNVDRIYDARTLFEHFRYTLSINPDDIMTINVRDSKMEIVEKTGNSRVVDLVPLSA